MKKTLAEFKAFIMRGNILDLAVGMVMGTAFTAIVKALVDNIIMPFVGGILGGINFETLSVMFRGSEILYGMFIQRIINFLIVAVCLFIVIKIMAAFSRKKKQEEEEKEEKEPEKSDEVLLLEEIRDLLKK